MHRRRSKRLALFMTGVMGMSVFTTFGPAVSADEHNDNEDTQTLRVHYENSEADFDDLGVWFWGDAANPSDEVSDWPDGKWFADHGTTDFGGYVDIELAEEASMLSLVVNNRDGDNVTEEDVDIDILSEDMDEVWITEEEQVKAYEPVDLPDDTLRVHFEPEDAPEPWGLWTWGDVAEEPDEWPVDAHDFTSEQTGTYGPYIDLDLAPDASGIGFLLVDQETGDQSDDMDFGDFDNHDQIFLKEGEGEAFTNPYHVSTDAPEEEPERSDGEEDISVTADVNRAFNYNEHAVLDVNIENNSDVGIRGIEVDATALGGEEAMSVDPDVGAVTLSAVHDTELGTHTLPVTVIDDNGGTYTTGVDVEITERVKEDGDFDWDESMVYFMLTDRFYDGNPENNDPYDLNYEEAAEDNPRGAYQGGDFAGVTENLDYLEDLGINTIWVSPIVENVGHDVGFDDPDGGAYFGYHGYWASDFETLNPHLGTLDEFHTMIDAAADRDIDIMVDVVLNHPGYGVKEEDALPEEEAPPGYPDEEVIERFNDMIRDDPGSDDLTMELADLPDFETERTDVREQIVDWQTSWLDRSTTENGNAIASYRVDTVKHVEDATWQHFKNELTREDPAFKMIGESWGAGQDNDDGYLNTGTMDSLLDFQFKDTAAQFARGDMEAAHEDLVERNDGLTSAATLGQFLGSHDEAGFKYNHGEEALLVGAALQMTAKGQPVVYYGEELGQSGDDNWPQYDNRYDLAWDDVEGNHIHEHYTKLLDFRGEHNEVLSRGDRNQVAGSDEDGYMVFSRAYDGEAVYTGLNTSDEEQTAVLDVSSDDTVVIDAYSGSTYEAADGTVEVTIPAAADGGTALLTTENGVIEGAGEDVEAPEEPETPADESDIPDNHLRVHFDAGDRNVDALGLWYWDGAAEPVEERYSWPGEARFEEGNTTDFGPYYDIELEEGADRLDLLVNNTGGDNITGDVAVDLISDDMNQIWLYEDGSYDLTPPADLADNEVRIHYDREGAEENWATWLFDDVANPSDEWPDDAKAFDGTNDFGAYVDVELAEAAEQLGFLFLNPETGDQTDDMAFQVDAGNQIFVQEGDDTAYNNPYYVTMAGLQSAEVSGEDELRLEFSDTSGLSEEALMEELSVEADGEAVAFDSVTIEDETTVLVHGDFDLSNAPFDVSFMERTAEAIVGWRLKDELYSYDGDLGAEVNEDGAATLKVWSPSADNVDVRLYDQDDQDSVITDVDMERQDRGVWEVTLDEENTDVDDLRGYYYHYMIERDGETVEALDPYAPSMAAWDSVNSDEHVGKAAIVDPAEIGPELDFADIDGFEKREDAIIYELHVRDFTSDPSIDDELDSEFGTFNAFKERLDYVEDLGVTHIQLLPVMSYFFSNEYEADQRMLDYDSTDTNYNWGYDPHSYFSLTGMYSEDPEDAEKRIEEFKMLIEEIHDRDMGVILDVVYNHTAREHIFEDLEPNYYHFMDADGTSRISFGGGRLGTTHEMSRRILVDSIMYWVEEFKVDGFRFDMMGDHDAESIQMAYDQAKEVNPNIVMIGEGWETFVGDENDQDIQPADQSWMQDTESVGSFSDDFRNELKSGFGSEGEPRFLTGGDRSIERIYDNLTANPHNFTATNPGDVVPYVAAHDNLTLHDVIAQSIQKDPKDHQEEIHQRIRLGNLMTLTAQGTSFIHAGQEFGRTKQFKHEDYREPVDEEDIPYKSTFMTDENGEPFEYPYFIHDSYDSTDAINLFDWEKATDEEAYPINAQTQDMASGMIELRRSTDAFRHATMEDIDERVSFIDAPEVGDEDLLIGFRAEDSDEEEAYHVLINADDTERTMTLEEDLTDGTVVADADEAGTTAVSNPAGFDLSAEEITIDPLTAVVIQTDAEEDRSTGPPSTVPGPPTDPGSPGDQVRIPNPQAGNDGRVEVEVGQSDRTVSLPLQAAAAAGDVNIIGDDFSLDLPQSLLESIQDQNGNEDMEVSFDQSETKDTEQLESPSGAVFAQAGPSFNFQLQSGNQSVDNFETPIRLSFDVDEDAEEDLLGIYRVDENGGWEYAGGEISDGSISTELHHFSTYTVLSLNQSFNDVSEDYWAHDTLKKLSARHVVEGMENGSFQPSKDVTRAEFAAMLTRAADLDADEATPFRDIDSDDWFAEEVAAAYEAGIVEGMSASLFEPDKQISREQMAAMIVRAHHELHGEMNVHEAGSFEDTEEVSGWAVDYVNAAQEFGLIQGRGDDRFAPQAEANRAESAQIMYNLLF
ncbi:pullulanase [Alkalicoccus chagannorensis]|uniref:pullulanase n=1 Tax=Alkalicoccus chagannorensis TaxID=427072 RepID=UPI00040AEBF0|nr:pullulanase [Alkalicoccus chagannorensis]